jgi:uncharacterized membrane protein YtjA (UPF0391 family)
MNTGGKSVATRAPRFGLGMESANGGIQRCNLASHSTTLWTVKAHIESYCTQTRRGGDSLILGRPIMLYWTVVFLVVAMIAGALGFGVIGGMAYGAAKILFFIFIVLFILSLVSGVVRRPVA